MELVLWLTGVLVTIAGCRFVILVFKRLTSREAMNDLIDKASEGFHNAADKVANNIKEKKKKKNEERQPIVTIR